MGMPWERDPRPAQPAHPAQQPRYVPPAGPPAIPPPNHPYPQPMPGQQMQPDVPIVARNPQTGEQVRVDLSTDLREAIRQAIVGAVVDNKDAMHAGTQRAIAKAVKAEVADEVEDQLEGSFTGGPATTRTFIQGAALDIGAAITAVMATMIGPDTNVFDKELWTLVGVMMLKTVLQTFLSYAMRFKAV